MHNRQHDWLLLLTTLASSLLLRCCQHLGLCACNPLLDLLLALLQGELDIPLVSLCSCTFNHLALANILVFLLLLGHKLWLRLDCCMRLRVHVLKATTVDASLDELCEVRLILGGVLLLKHLHVLSHVLAHDAVAVCIGIVLGLCALLLWR